MKTLATLAMLVAAVASYAQERNSTGFYYPTGSADQGGYIGFLSYNSNFNGYHLADDFQAAFDAPVYAIDNGEVVESRSDVGSYGGDGIDGGAFIVKGITGEGATYYALYGHINVDSLPTVGTVLTAGTQVARVGHYYSGGDDISHIHFGIMPDTMPGNPYLGYTSDTNDLHGFANPWHDKNVNGADFAGYLDHATPVGAATPEPTSALALAAGAAALLRRRKNKVA